MKKIINSVFMIVAMALLISSCGKDPITPNPDPDPSGGDHNVLWSYDMGFGAMDDITPAIDNNDNSYYSIANGETSKVVVFALDKDGNELWKNELDASSVGKTIYADNKIFVSTDSPVSIYCINAASGSTEWVKNLTEEYDFQWLPVTAFANGRLYISSGQIMDGFLVAYDLSGNEVWVKQTYLLGGTLNLSVSGNALYFHDGNSLFRYNDNGASCDSIWEYDFSNKSSRGMLNFYTLPIGEDGNIYIREENINIISPDGQLVSTINLDATYDQSVSNITLTSNNDILIGKGNLVKMSNTGNVEWETDINDGMLINPSFATAPVISTSGDFYDAQLFGLYSVKSNGKLNWKENAETGAGTEYGNLHPPILTHEGNIISVSAEQKFVRCFKGDGNGLATGGWPKPFGDYGNTSSK